MTLLSASIRRSVYLVSSRVLVPGLDSIPVRLIIPHTITPCVVSGPMDEGRLVKARPCGGFARSFDLGTRHPNFLYGNVIRLTPLPRSSP
ncbi:hypothetical protein TIFTF001_037807 [Ficus carica]|uniref:Uncharacterized protein n=1 Tax=Ficus carica TaxID=3494 RepID=A0AA88E6N5_FICCA|nr:hypothetical protein TIFTF001_037807 [Ficus carica]